MISWNSAPALRAVAATTHSIFDNRVLLDRAAEIAPQAINWIWDGHLASGKLNLLGGSPGTGKSGIVINLTAAVSRGSAECPLPDASIPPQGHVVILASEDGVEDTIIPRLIAAGANMDFVHIVRGTVVHGRPRPFCAEDCDKLSAELDKLSGVRLVIIDPITQMVRKNGNSNTEVRKALEPLIELAEKHGFAILGVAHLAKGSQKRSPLERVAGSLAFGALSRIVLLTVRGEPEEDGAAGATPAPCALVRIKSNIGADGGGFSYTVRPAAFGFGLQQFKSSVICWEGRLTGSAKSILEGIEGAGSSGGSGALAKAKAFLVEHLQGGSQPATLIQEQADAARISRATLRRAREDLGVIVERLRNGAQASPWMWSLPGSGGSGTSSGGPPVLPVGSMFATGPVGPGVFNHGSQPGVALFHPAPVAPGFAHPMPMPARLPEVLPSVSESGHIEHLDHLDHLDHLEQDAPDEQLEHLEQPVLASHATPYRGTSEDEDEDEDDEDEAPKHYAMESAILEQLIGKCRTRYASASVASMDDHDFLYTLGEIVTDTVRSAGLEDSGEEKLYINAIEQSTWWA